MAVSKQRIKGRKKIKIGNKYKLKLFAYYKDDTLLRHIILQPIIDDKMLEIPLLNSSRSNVYTTPNLKGLYYISP